MNNLILLKVISSTSAEIHLQSLASNRPKNLISSEAKGLKQKNKSIADYSSSQALK